MPPLEAEPSCSPRRGPHGIVETHSPELEVGWGEALLRAGYSPNIVTPRRLLPQHRPRAHNRWLVADGLEPAANWG